MTVALLAATDINAKKPTEATDLLTLFSGEWVNSSGGPGYEEILMFDIDNSTKERICKYTIGLGELGETSMDLKWTFLQDDPSCLVLIYEDGSTTAFNIKDLTDTELITDTGNVYKKR